MSRKWLKPPVKPADESVSPEGAELPDVKISRLVPINYIRAWHILRNTPFKQLKAEILKLPLKKFAYVAGAGIWLYMTYTFICWFLGKAPS